MDEILVVRTVIAVIQIVLLIIQIVGKAPILCIPIVLLTVLSFILGQM